MGCCSIVSGKPTASVRERYADHVPADYYTCIAVWEWIAREAVSGSNTTARSLTCAWHDCSCSAPAVSWTHSYRQPTIFGYMYSTITIDRQPFDVAPPLLVGLQVDTYRPDWLAGDLWQDWHGDNAKDFWAETLAHPFASMQLSNGSYISVSEIYMHDEILLDEASIIKTGRCIADEAYSWGFSSLLLLTSCCYTIAFALALILLQTDVYWNSRHDREHQSHSIYTDVLYLAEELKKTFGQNIEDHMKSPESFEKRVNRWKQGLRLDVRELPLSRWQEWRLFRAMKRADRKAKIAPALVNTYDPTLELRNLSSRTPGGSAIPDTACRGLIGGEGTESNFEAASRSDDRSTSGELAPSLAGVEIPAGGFGHDGMVLKEPAAESSLLRDEVSGGAVREGWSSRDRLQRSD
jgi:hypothetical protein